MKQLVAGLASFMVTSMWCSAQTELATITVHAGDFTRENTLVYASMEGINLNLANGHLALFTENDKEIEYQLDHGGITKLFWILKEQLAPGEERQFTLKSMPFVETDKNAPSIQVLKYNGNLIINADGKNVLQYNFVEAPLPEGANELYGRAGYIHPLWTPSGEILTRINPPDHYHHVGIWNPWTHTKYRNEEVDFWNLLSAQGTVRPNAIISTTSNNLFGGFRAIHNHIYLNGKTKYGFEVVMKEEWDVRAWKLADKGWVVDFVSTLNNPTDTIFTILKYRYQGFGFRATEKWDDKSATILTSEGKNKTDGNSTRTRWCDINGVSSTGTSGIVFITNPNNFNYPEPIRIWPTGANKGKENVFFNFNPAMDRDWNLYPGTDYQLKYRMFIYDGKIDKDEAEKLWQDYAHPPKVTVDHIRK